MSPIHCWRLASAAHSVKREPEENFTSFGRVAIDFEHWRAASAALCAKREPEENFAILSGKPVDFELSPCILGYAYASEATADMRIRRPAAPDMRIRGPPAGGYERRY